MHMWFLPSKSLAFPQSLLFFSWLLPNTVSSHCRFHLCKFPYLVQLICNSQIGSPTSLHRVTTMLRGIQQGTLLPTCFIVTTPTVPYNLFSATLCVCFFLYFCDFSWWLSCLRCPCMLCWRAGLHPPKNQQSMVTRVRETGLTASPGHGLSCHWPSA